MLKFGEMLQSIMGNFKSIIGTCLLRLTNSGNAVLVATAAYKRRLTYNVMVKTCNWATLYYF